MGDVALTAVAASEGCINERGSCFGSLSWHQVGWIRAQYVEEAVAAANRMQ
jgi:hypothetical protein